MEDNYKIQNITEVVCVDVIANNNDNLNRLHVLYPQEKTEISAPKTHHIATIIDTTKTDDNLV